MTKLKLVIVCILSLSLFAEEEFQGIVEGISDTQYEEVGVISEPTIIESSNMDGMEIVKFESEIQREQKAEVVEPTVDAVFIKRVENNISKNEEQNLSQQESINPIFRTFDEAIKVAKEKNKIILLDVVANNCQFCKKMEQEVLSKENVQEAIKKDFVLAQVNEDREPLPLRLSSQMTPMFVFITKTETVEDMRFGFIKEDEFLKLLEKEKNKLAK